MSQSKEVYVIPKKLNRQSEIDSMEIGQTVSIARRIDLSFGISPEQTQDHSRLLRGILDQQANRARRKDRTKEYTVENGTFISRGGAMIVCATVTRLV